MTLLKRAIVGLCGIAALGAGVATHHSSAAHAAAVPRPGPAAHPVSRLADPGTVSVRTMALVSLTTPDTSLDPSPMPLAQSLGSYFTADPAVWHAPLTLGMSARYVADGTSSIPIFLVAPTRMTTDYTDWTDPNSFVSNVQSEVTVWLSDTAAPMTDASIEFSVTVETAGEPTHGVMLKYELS